MAPIPSAGEPSRLFEAVQGRKEGARLHREGAVRDLVDTARNAEAVQGSGGEGLEDQQVDGAAGVVPEEMVCPASRLAEGVRVGPAEEMGLHVQLRVRLFSRSEHC